MTGHPVNKDILWADHTCNTSMCIRGHTPSIWGLIHLLLFVLIWRECIETFQSDAVAMNQVGRAVSGDTLSLGWHCTNRLLPLWGIVSLLRSVSCSDDIVSQCHYWRGRVHNRNAIGLPIHLESLWRPCCEMLCHCQWAFQLVLCARRTDFPSGW